MLEIVKKLVMLGAIMSFLLVRVLPYGTVYSSLLLTHW